MAIRRKQRRLLREPAATPEHHSPEHWVRRAEEEAELAAWEAEEEVIDQIERGMAWVVPGELAAQAAAIAAECSVAEASGSPVDALKAARDAAMLLAADAAAGALAHDTE